MEKGEPVAGRTYVLRGYMVNQPAMGLTRASRGYRIGHIGRWDIYLNKGKEIEMLTNELKKGDRIQLRNGWYATIKDNMKGNTRLATVEGIFTEMGSVYGHDIVFKVNSDGTRTMIEHTPNQMKLMGRVNALGF